MEKKIGFVGVGELSTLLAAKVDKLEPKIQLVDDEASQPYLPKMAIPYMKMAMLADGLLGVHPKHPPRKVEKGPGRNEPCPCGSGFKFKKCCINKSNILNHE